MYKHVVYHVRISQCLQVGICLVDHFSNKHLKRHHTSHFVRKRDPFDVAVLRWCWIYSFWYDWFAIHAVLLRWWRCWRCCCCRMAVSFHQPLLVARLRNRLHSWMESICRQCCRRQFGKNRQRTKTREGRSDGEEEEDNGNIKGEAVVVLPKGWKTKTSAASVFSQLKLTSEKLEQVTRPFPLLLCISFGDLVDYV